MGLTPETLQSLGGIHPSVESSAVDWLCANFGIAAAQFSNSSCSSDERFPAVTSPSDTRGPDAPGGASGTHGPREKDVSPSTLKEDTGRDSQP